MSGSIGIASDAAESAVRTIAPARTAGASPRTASAVSCAASAVSRAAGAPSSACTAGPISASGVAPSGDCGDARGASMTCVLAAGGGRGSLRRRSAM